MMPFGGKKTAFLQGKGASFILLFVTH